MKRHDKKINFLLSAAFLCVLPVFAHAQTKQTREEFKPGGKFSMQFFGDYYYKFAGDSHPFSTAEYADEPKNFNAFDIRRLYLGYAYDFTPKISGKVIVAHEGNTLAGGKRTFYLKVAQLEVRNIIPLGNLIVGETGTPTFSTFTQKIWGYRSVEKSMPGMRKFGTSNDLGVALTGSFSDDKTIGYMLMVGNGNDSRKESDAYKKVYAEVHAKLDNKYLLEIYADYEGGDDNGTDRSRTTLKGFAGYQTPDITLGLSFIKQWRNNEIFPGLDSNPTGISVFTHGRLAGDRLKGFARYDFYDSDFSTAYNEQFILFGLDYLVAADIHFMPNVWINTYSAKRGANALDADVVGRVTLSYTF